MGEKVLQALQALQGLQEPIGTNGGLLEIRALKDLEHNELQGPLSGSLHSTS